MKKPSKEEARVIGEQGQADEAFAKSYPAILEYLLTTMWDDGSPREPSALSMTIKDGLWQAALNDKALKTSAYSSAATMREALASMEKALKAGQLGWRAWKRGK